MCDKAVNSYSPALKFVLDWFVKSDMIEKLDSAMIILTDDYIDLGSGFVTSLSMI